MTTPVANFTGDNADTPFMVFAASEGAWGNTLVVEYANFNDSENEFDIVVYQKSVPAGKTQPILTLLETWTVSRSYKTDGFGKQLFLEDKINGKSDYIYVINNNDVPEANNFAHTVTDEVLFTGDGNTSSFSGNLANANAFLVGKSVQRNSFSIDLTGDGEPDIIENGQGGLTGPGGITGTISYTTGAYTVNFSSNLVSGFSGKASYTYSSSRQLAQGGDGGDPSLSDVVAALRLFENREEYPVRILVQPAIQGLSDTDYVAMQKELQRIAETRGDCIAILNLPSDKTSVEDAYMWMRQVQQIDSSYVATYGPDIRFKDVYNDVVITAPPAGFVAAAYAETDAQFGPHMPPAGTDTATLDVLGVTQRYSEGEYDLLYPESLNLIQDLNGSGPTINGARTGLKKKSHFQDINIRRLLIEIRATARNFLVNYKFKLHNDFTMLQVTEKLESYLSTVDGVVEFRVVCNRTNNTAAVIDSNLLKVDIYIRPEIMIEFIQLQSIVTDSGVSFEELIATGGNF